MSNGSDGLYQRIVKRLKKGEWVVLKKSDGSYAVCYGMNKNKIQRTEFEADSVSEAIRRAKEQRHVRLSTEDYLNDAYEKGKIRIIDTLWHNEMPSVSATWCKKKFNDIEVDDEDYINGDDYDDEDDDYPVEDISTKLSQAPASKKTSRLNRTISFT